MNKQIAIDILVPKGAKGCHVQLSNMEQFTEQFHEDDFLIDDICAEGHRALNELSEQVLDQIATDNSIPKVVMGSYSDEAYCLFDFYDMYEDDFGQCLIEYEFTSTGS